ncbi:hypothetical protein TM48_03767 [Mycobacterium shottsii]|uniref:Uncharacterized protein n=1 Tax=Mycobacterium shottsii TaxID=133549 RepID=A0A7I7LIH8_9MYCO|nr:hypothetical protein TM48_03767 [Mycobacterium shottsii]BBX59564.1 hypothetical protein MSHO_49090 [Mycobacterium shottsii]
MRTAARCARDGLIAAPTNLPVDAVRASPFRCCLFTGGHSIPPIAPSLAIGKETLAYCGNTSRRQRPERVLAVSGVVLDLVAAGCGVAQRFTNCVVVKLETGLLEGDQEARK